MTTIVRGHTASQYVTPDYQPVQRPDPTASNRTSERYVSKQWAADSLLGRLWVEHSTDQLQKANSFIANTAAERHNTYSARLAQLAQQYRARAGKELVQLLAAEYALPWVDIARMVDVSVPAIRKWRMSGNVNPENAGKLADLAAFAHLLSENDVRPAAWLSTPLFAGYMVAPKHLYSPGQAGALADVALGTGDVQKLLARVEPDWRVRYDARGYDVRRFDDGSYGIVNTDE